MLPHVKRLADGIARFGFTFVGVFDPMKPTPPFVYSIGMTAKNMPEVLMIGGFHPHIAERILADVLAHWQVHGPTTEGLMPNMIRFKDASLHPLKMRLIENALPVVDEYVIQAQQFYTRDDIRVVQVLWPDTNGVFPDEPGYLVALTQPVLPRNPVPYNPQADT
jgi:hypothetical protein